MRPIITTMALLSAIACLFLIISAPRELSAAGGKDDGAGLGQEERELRFFLNSDPHTLDPHLAGDVVSSNHAGLVYEQLFEYDLFARPLKLKPCLAAAMPTYSEDRKTLTIKVRDDVFFQPDICFKGGQKRKMVASDVVYSIKRFAVQPRTPGWWVADGRIEGLNDLREKAKNPDKVYDTFDAYLGYINKLAMDEEVSGLSADDKKGIVTIKLTEPFANFVHTLAMSYYAVVPHEAVNHYGRNFYVNPVGTGPYVLQVYQFGKKLVYKASPSYRDVRYPQLPANAKQGEGMEDLARYKPLVGKRLPISNTLTYTIQSFDEENPDNYDPKQHWTGFLKGNIDVSGISSERWKEVFPKGKLSETLKKMGVRAQSYERPVVEYLVFNMNDPVLGTKAGKKGKALRKAIALGFDREAYIKDTLNGRGTIAKNIIMKGFLGHDPEFAFSTSKLDIEAAHKHLEDAGFTIKKSEDGNPIVSDPTTGEQVSVSVLCRGTSGSSLEMGKLLEKCGKALGIDIYADLMQFSEFLKMQRENKGQAYNAGWVFDYPDAENILSLLYGKNAVKNGVNAARFKNAEFDKAFDEMGALDADDPEYAKAKAKLIAKMLKIVDEETPWAPIYFSRTVRLMHEHYTPAPANDFAYNLTKYAAGKKTKAKKD